MLNSEYADFFTTQLKLLYCMLQLFNLCELSTIPVICVDMTNTLYVVQRNKCYHA